jgi:hypothetical protein
MLASDGLSNLKPSIAPTESSYVSLTIEKKLGKCNPHQILMYALKDSDEQSEVATYRVVSTLREERS